jgi:ABC-type sulfate/molybdate transport systems ATPase subunit
MALLASVAVRPDRAVVVVTHDNRIFGFADTIAYMEDGRIVRTESRPHGAETPAGVSPTAASAHEYRQTISLPRSGATD